MAARQSIRKLRHWKQQYNKDAAFVWRKDVTWHGKKIKRGTKVSKTILEEMGGAKLRRMWESHTIELFEFQPTVMERAEPASFSFEQPESTEEEGTEEEAPAEGSDESEGESAEEEGDEG